MYPHVETLRATEKVLRVSLHMSVSLPLMRQTAARILGRNKRGPTELLRLVTPAQDCRCYQVKGKVPGHLGVVTRTYSKARDFIGLYVI